ncbi:hypothetical protein M430DRAFT_37699, partial [Amorphotheca resinae ATCC 22711]
MSAAPQELESSLAKLSIDPQPSKSSSAFKKKQQAVADSWEDEESDSGEDTDRPISPQQSKDYPAAPPPTPISPSTSTSEYESFINPYGYSPDASPSARSERPGARPQKTDAVAKRMIAGALGLKAPKKTEEQRAYDRAVKEKEMKRRNLEKEAAARAKEEAEKAKAAVWS